MALRLNKEVNVWSIGTTLAAFISMFVWLQADVRALQQQDLEIKATITRVETTFSRRIDLADIRSERDREAILTIQGDIRVVRQILEGMRPPLRQ